jgi:hypothetical protein
MTQTVPTRSAEGLEKESLELVRNAIILHPDLPAIQLSENLVNGAEKSFLAELNRALAIRHFAQMIQSERRKTKEASAPQPSLFGMDELPRRIITPEGKRPLLKAATTTQIRAYVKTLNAKHRERIAQLQSVLKIMGKYARKNRGITASEAAQLEAAKEAKKAAK